MCPFTFWLITVAGGDDSPVQTLIRNQLQVLQSCGFCLQKFTVMKSSCCFFSMKNLLLSDSWVIHVIHSQIMTHCWYLFSVVFTFCNCSWRPEEQNRREVSHSDFILKQSHNYPEQTTKNRSSDSLFTYVGVNLFNVNYLQWNVRSLTFIWTKRGWRSSSFFLCHCWKFC